MNKISKYLDEALRHLSIAEHITYSTFPLVNDKKLLLKILEQIYKSLINLINAALLLKNKRIVKNNKKNLIRFLKLKRFYNIKEEEIKKIIEIIEISNRHRMSAMEFPRKENIVIMLDNLRTITMGIKKIKEYLSLIRSIFVRINLTYNKISTKK